MEWVNVTAKSLPEAIDLALDNLGVDEAEAEIEVLEEPKQGLFGRTRGNARVKARVKPRSTRPKVERGRNKRRREGGSEGGGRSARDSEDKEARAKTEGNSRSQGKGPSDKGRDRGPRDGESRNRNNRGGGSGNGQKAEAARGGSSQGGRPKKQRASTPPKEAPVEEVSATIESFLSGLTDAFGLDGGVQVVSDGDDGLVGQVEGRHGLLVGPRGRTLDAIQELTRVTAQRSSPSSIRIKVDVGGYRQVRAEALQAFAQEAAEAAKADGKERSLEPMSSADRKIVHDALNDVDGVETRSAGTEPRRRVVVVPAEVVDDDGADEADDDVAADIDEVAEEVASDEVADEDADESESVVD